MSMRFRGTGMQRMEGFSVSNNIKKYLKLTNNATETGRIKEYWSKII